MRSVPGTRAIAFDLFHTLVDPEDFRPKSFVRTREVARLLGLPLEEFERAWSAELPIRMTATRPTVTERVQAYCRRVGVEPAGDVWTEVTDLLGRYADRAILQPRASVLATLRSLRNRGWTLGVVSNCDEREVRAWRGSSLSSLFDAAVMSCEVGFAKPAPEAYRALVPRWGSVPLSEAIFVGDGSNGELAGARRAGFARAVFHDGFVSTNGLRSAEANARLREEADETISDLAELLELGSPRRERA